MFGFLKDKLKKAIGAFSSSAKEDVKEEQVSDAKAIEEAKREEARLAKKTKPAPAKPAQKPVLEKKTPSKEEKRPAEAKREELKRDPAKTREKPTPAQKAQSQKEIPRREDAPEKPPVERKIAEERIAPKEKEPEKRTEKEKTAHHVPEKTVEKTREKEKKTPEKEKAPAPQAPEPKERGFFKRLFGKKEPEEEIAAPPEAEPVIDTLDAIDEELEQVEEDIADDKAYEEHATVVAAEPLRATQKEETPDAEEQQSGFFGKLKEAFTKKTLTSEKFDELFWELELAMLENNVAVEVIEKIKGDLKEELTSGKVSRMGIEDMITTRLRSSIEELFDVPTFDLIERIKDGKRPFIISMIGVNGAGKTTTLAKIVHLLKKEGLTVVVAASDTFRAAAIDQLKEHTDRLDVKLISQGYGADPAAVAFDAIKHAESKGIDVVLIDTAGRLHSNTNLMAELEKVVRVAKPDMKIFIGEAITGNDCVEQAKVFNDLVGIDAIILSKADIDEKGGAAISVSYVTGKPILFLGMGQTYDDLVPFDKEKIIASLDLG
jgi:fused signal recognition particle receptor